MNEMNEEDIDKIINENEEIQHWRSLPKSQRPRLTRKQLVRMFKESSLAETI